MSRPNRQDSAHRTSTAIRIRSDLHAQLVKAAEERDVSMNWLMNKALEDYLSRLIPVDEMVWTRGEPRG